MNQQTDRQMHQGNWSCGKCGSAITELPFQPDPARLDQLTCRGCHAAKMEKRQNTTRQMHQGDWKCGKCNAAITELPFKPNPDRESELTCRDCFMKSR